MSALGAGRTAAVVLAGGAGTRFGGSVSKVYVPLAGRPILAYSLEVLAASDHVDDVVVVIRAQDRDRCDAVSAVAPCTKVRAVVAGGATRQASEWSGVQAIRDHCTGADLVLLHDAARPFLTLQLVADLVDTTRHHGCGALPARMLGGDLVRRDGSPRPSGDLVAVQTPQVFPLATLLAVYTHAMAEGFEGVDTAQTIQRFSDLPIRWVDGGAPNPKVTHPEDLVAAEALAATWHGGRWRR